MEGDKDKRLGESNWQREKDEAKGMRGKSEIGRRKAEGKRKPVRDSGAWASRGGLRLR